MVRVVAEVGAHGARRAMIRDVGRTDAGQRRGVADLPGEGAILRTGRAQTAPDPTHSGETGRSARAAAFAAGSASRGAATRSRAAAGGVQLSRVSRFSPGRGGVLGLAVT